MAPEQWLEIVTQQSDQFALGLIIYKWLCDDKGDDKRVFEFKRGKQKYRSFKSNDCTDVPLKVERVVRKALAIAYEKRYQTISAFAVAFEEAVHSSYPQYGQQPTLFSIALLLTSVDTREGKCH